MVNKHRHEISLPMNKSEIIGTIDLEFFQLAVEIFQSMIDVIKQ
jgi:hypothetical protein